MKAFKVQQANDGKWIASHKSGFKMVFRSREEADQWVDRHIKYKTKF